MNIGDFGEKAFLKEIVSEAATTAKQEHFDDCVIVDLESVLGVPNLPYLVYSLDHPSFVRHAAEAIPPFRFYGRWLTACTCNDVIAMGARCHGFSLDLSAPLETPIEDIRELLKGITDVVERYGASYEGGNFDASNLETVGYSWGIAPRNGIVRRSGARVGDIIAVTGELGTGWVEYNIRKADAYKSLSPDIANKLRDYKQMPVAAVEPITKAAELGLLTSGMDLSDGVVEFLHTICDRNGLGVVVEFSQLPVSREAKAGVPLFRNFGDCPEILQEFPELVALEAGYDSPMVHAFTVDADRWSEAVQLFEKSGARLHQIGHVIKGSGPKLSIKRKLRAIPPFWDDQCRQGSTKDAWFNFIRTLMDSDS